MNRITVLLLLTLFLAAGHALSAQPVDVADLSISGTDSPDPASAGGTVTYSLIATNAGPDRAKNVDVTIGLGSGLTFASGTGCSVAAGSVTCSLGNLDVGSQAFSVTLNVDPDATGTVTSTLGIASNHPHASDPNPGNNSSSISTTINVSADLSISISDSADPIVPNASVIYTIVVTNNGPSPASNVQVVNTIPAGAVFVSAPGCSESAGTVTCNLGAMAASANSNINITITAPATPGTITNSASVSSSTADSNSGNNSDSENTYIDTLPTASDDNYSVDEDQTLNQPASGVLGNDTDPDGPSLTAVLVNNVASGTLNLNADGSFDYTPDSNFSGNVTFTYQANDSLGLSNVATVTITVNPINDAPLADDQNLSTDEDTDLGITLTGSDVENDSLSFSVVDGPSNGTLNGTEPNLTYTPNENFSGSDSFTYKANDGQEDSNVATVSITVNSVNDAPVADNDSYSVDEDGSLTVSAAGVLGNDTDADNDGLTAELVSTTSNGTLGLNADGSFNYTPNSNFNGNDSFTYKAKDASEDSGNATVTITVNPVNDAPLATDDSYNVDEDGTLTVPVAGVLGNDADIDNDPMTAGLVSDVSNGTLALSSDGSFVYTPNEDFNGTDSFTYQANDGSENSNTVTVTITVNSVNDAPEAEDDSYSVDEDGTLNVSALSGALSGVLSNDTDVENDSLTAVLVSTTQNGTLTLNDDGSFDYTPNENFHGSDSFTYKANDGSDDSSDATVTITVNSVNDNPEANDDSATTPQDTDVTIDLLGNDSDVDNDTLSITNLGAASNGTVTNNNDGTVTYSPNTGFFGSDSFTYTADDGNGGSDTATVNVTVDQVIPPVSISINDTTVIEPLNGSFNATLTITLSDEAQTDVTVDYATANGSATGSDYTDTNGTVTIPAGSTSAQITIEILADSDLFEGNETVMVNLSNPSGATIDDGQGAITVSETCVYCDDFEDGVRATDWTYLKPNWVESNGTLQGTPNKKKAIAIANPVFSAGCTNCSVNTSMSTLGGHRNRVILLAWYVDKKNTVELMMQEEKGKWVLRHKVAGNIVGKAKGSTTILPNVSYNVDLSFDGTNFVVRVDGQTVITMPAAASVPNGTVGFTVKNTTGTFGHILVN